VTPEPELISRTLDGKDWAFLVMITDGISSILSDQEIVDVARPEKSPEKAAHEIVSFAEELGAEDNCTALVLPLAGFGKVVGPDLTKDLREWRIKEQIGSERHRRM
jgi:protein phosphatase PTC6